MSGLRHNAADHDAMVHEHGQFTDTVGDAVIRIQDEAYRLGHERGTKEADGSLIEALAFAVRFWDQLTPADAERMRAVLVKAQGAAA